MPAALPSRAAADGLARPVGRRGWVTWDMPEGCNSPKVHGSSRFLLSGLLLLLCASTRSSRSLSLSCSPPPTDEVSHLQGAAACGTPGGSRAMPSPYQGTLACPKPGTPGDFSPARDVSVDAEF